MKIVTRRAFNHSFGHFRPERFGIGRVRSVVITNAVTDTWRPLRGL